MAISNLVDKASYVGNGSNTNFSIPFTILVSDQAEVGVILRDITLGATNPVDTPQVFGALQNYTLSGAVPPGTPFNTTVVMNVAPTSNQIVVVYRIFPLTQILTLLTSGQFDFANIDLALDRIVVMCQYLNEKISRMPILPQATQISAANTQCTEMQANTVMGFNGTKFVPMAVSSISSAILSLVGDVVASGGASSVATIQPGVVTLAKMANLAANSIIGNNTGSPATPLALTAAQVTAFLNVATTALKGLIPAWPNNTTTFFRGDGTYATPQSPLFTAYIREEQTSGTQGGTFTAGSWVKRTLNTITDPNSIVTSLISNSFTLPAGTYLIEVSAPACSVDLHGCRLNNTTDSIITATGQSGVANHSSGVQTSSTLIWTGTLAGSKTFEIDHQCQTSENTVGLGQAMGSVFTVANETYTQVLIQKIG